MKRCKSLLVLLCFCHVKGLILFPCHDACDAHIFSSSLKSPFLSHTSLYHLFWLASSFSPHLPVFCAPPSLQLCLSWSSPNHCSPRASHFRFGVALWPPTLSLLLTSPLVPQIFLFFSWLLPLKVFFGGLITVASKLHTKSQRDCYCEAYKGIQAVIAISSGGVWPVSGVKLCLAIWIGGVFHQWATCYFSVSCHWHSPSSSLKTP